MARLLMPSPVATAAAAAVMEEYHRSQHLLSPKEQQDRATGPARATATATPAAPIPSSLLYHTHRRRRRTRYSSQPSGRRMSRRRDTIVVTVPNLTQSRLRKRVACA